jgi:hypothetical protein
MSKLPNALRALHYLLIRIRHHVGTDTEPERAARLLDHAERLVVLLIQGEEAEFRRYISNATSEFPEFEGILQRYDETLVPA